MIEFHYFVISPIKLLIKLDDVKRIDRFHEPPKQGLFWLNFYFF